eukprot:jgi/Mesen1/1129/ME000123S00302
MAPRENGPSEIEVVVESTGSETSKAVSNVTVDDDARLKDDIYTAAAYGDIDKLRRLIETEGHHINTPDAGGYRALQWSALNNKVAIAQYLLERGAGVDLRDGSGQTALHWSAVRGATGVADLLLTHGADLEAADSHGYKLDSFRERGPRGGRAWGAAGCTPLHWAALKGNLEVATVLVQAGGSREHLLIPDATGATAAQLAADKGHRHVALFLSNARRVYDSQWESGAGRWAQLLGRTGLAPALWTLIVVLLVSFIHTIAISSSLPRMTAGEAGWAAACVLLGVSGLFLLYRASRFIVRPVRSKHCAACKRCVEQFDHHCPWISNCVGKKNKWHFFVFLCLETAAMIIALALALCRLAAEEGAPAHVGAWLHNVAVTHSGALLFVISDAFMLLSVLMLTGLQGVQIGRNITTNEMANAHRYGYLRGPDGRFFNPFDRGYLLNCSDFFLHGQNEDVEQPWKPTTPPSSWLRKLFYGGRQVTSHTHAGDVASMAASMMDSSHGALETALGVDAKSSVDSRSTAALADDGLWRREATASASGNGSTGDGVGERERREHVHMHGCSHQHRGAAAAPASSAGASTPLGLGLGLARKSNHGFLPSTCRAGVLPDSGGQS